MELFHICSYYYGRPALYSNLFEGLEHQENLHNSMYVPLPFGTDIKAVPEKPGILLSPCYAGWNRVLFHIKHRRIFRDIQKKADCAKYDAYHAHTLFSNGYIAHRLGKKYGIPYTVTVQSTDIHVFFEKIPYLRYMGRKILKQAKAVFFISESQRDMTIENYVRSGDRQLIREKAYVIPYGVDRFWLENIMPMRTLKEKNSYKIIYAGEITRNKNICQIARAIQCLEPQGYTGELTVVGNVVDRLEAERLSEFPFVTVHERVSKEKLIEHYRENDFLALVSKRETFGLVCAEAMTQGLPVLYTRGQGFDTQFRDGEIGYAVDSNDPEDIAAAIVRTLEHYDSLSERCVSACARFDWDKVAADYSAVFKNIDLESKRTTT